MRDYTARDFVQATATKAKTPVMMIQTDGSCATSSRYFTEIDGIPDSAKAELYDNELAFLTFDSETEARSLFRSIEENFPAPGHTTLSIIVVLGIPGREAPLYFDQIHGSHRTHSLAA